MWQVFFYFLQLVNVNIPVFDINSSSMPVSGQHCLFGRRGVSLRKLMAAGGWSFFDDVKRELECCICQEQFNETWELKILICLYTFSKSSLEDWLNQQARGKLSCLTCRQITECPETKSLERNCFPRRNSSSDNRGRPGTSHQGRMLHGIWK